jgi:hypothetical protein
MTTIGKREIRKPKLFMEQDKAAKAHQQIQQDNLNLLSQIANSTQSKSNSPHLLKLLCEDDTKLTVCLLS